MPFCRRKLGRAQPHLLLLASMLRSWTSLHPKDGTVLWDGNHNHLSGFVLHPERQVGPGALKWRLPKGQEVAQLFVALCELCLVNLARGIWLPTSQVTVSRAGRCSGAAGLQGGMAPRALLLANRCLCMELNPLANPFWPAGASRRESSSGEMASRSRGAGRYVHPSTSSQCAPVPSSSLARGSGDTADAIA